MQNKNRIKSRKLKVERLGVAALLAFIFSLSTLSAQESINAAGGNASGSGGSASYSVGQVFYQTHTGTNGSVAEGAQQAYEISVVTAIEEAAGINLIARAYPNPTTDYLNLDVQDFETSTLHFQLYDMQGKILLDEKIQGNITSIDMSKLMPAIYFVRVIQGQREVKIFKIIKK